MYRYVKVAVHLLWSLCCAIPSNCPIFAATKVPVVRGKACFGRVILIFSSFAKCFIVFDSSIKLHLCVYERGTHVHRAIQAIHVTNGLLEVASLLVVRREAYSQRLLTTSTRHLRLISHNTGL